MIRTVVLCASLLGVQGVGSPGPEAKQAEALAKYNELREKAPETAEAQWKLALWCEQNGLKAEMVVHLGAVVRLDPAREAAWRKLGFKKRNGRWMNDDEVADEAEQKKADKLWSARLKKIHKDIHGGRKQAEAQEALDAVTDPRAVASVYREFVGGGQADQLIAVQTIGHIDSGLSSKLLALLSVYGKSPEVRRRATETLRGRDPDDFMDVLVALLGDPLKYEVRRVGGPGSPGALFVEGKRFNVNRVYDAPLPPTVTPRPGDIIVYDGSGMPVIERPNMMGSSSTPISVGKKGGGLFLNTQSVTVYSPAQAAAEAQRAAASAQLQLAYDVAELDALNEQQARFNDLVINVLKDATGKDHGKAPAAWRDALPGRKPYPKRSVKPTYAELVPPAYRPTFFQLGLVSSLTTRPVDN